MREFSNEEAIALSGLTRGQIDQLIARWGYGVYGSRGPQRARFFCATDMFNLMLAGALHGLGLSMPAIRDILLGGLGMYRWDRELDRPAEVYPGQIAAGEGRQSIVIYRYKDELNARVVKSDDASALRGPRGTVALVIDATGMVERIEEAAEAMAR